MDGTVLGARRAHHDHGEAATEEAGALHLGRDSRAEALVPLQRERGDVAARDDVHGDDDASEHHLVAGRHDRPLDPPSPDVRPVRGAAILHHDLAVLQRELRVQARQAHVRDHHVGGRLPAYDHRGVRLERHRQRPFAVGDQQEDAVSREVDLADPLRRTGRERRGVLGRVLQIAPDDTTGAPRRGLRNCACGITQA